jgi:subtilisin family serine protease
LAQSYEPEEGKEQEASGKGQELLTYNDPLLSRQTYLQTILYPDALDACTRNGNKKVSVAIVDSAFDTSHEDFGSNIIAKKDIANKDDDVNPPFGKDTDMERAHGTYSAGIIGASSNNGLGVMSIGSDAVKISLYKAAKDG